MAATDSILALTKSSPVPVGPGTRRKAKYFQPPAVRPGFQAKKGQAVAAKPVKADPESYDIFNYPFPYSETGYGLSQFVETRPWQSPFTALYGTGLGKTSTCANEITKDCDRMIALYRQPEGITADPALLTVDFGDIERRVIADLSKPPEEPRIVRMPAADPSRRISFFRPSLNYIMQGTDDTSLKSSVPNTQYSVDDNKPKAADEIPTAEEEYGIHIPRRRGSMYLADFTNPAKLKERIAMCVKALRPELDKFDAIAFTGMSGTLIAPPVAMELGKELLMVRKKAESSHSSFTVEGDYAARRFIIIDDFRASGRTERNILTAVKEVAPQAKYMGFLSGIHIEQEDIDKARRTGKSVLQAEQPY